MQSGLGERDRKAEIVDVFADAFRNGEMPGLELSTPIS